MKFVQLVIIAVLASYAISETVTSHAISERQSKLIADQQDLITQLTEANQKLEAGIVEIESADERLKDGANEAVASIGSDLNRVIAAAYAYKAQCERKISELEDGK